MSVCVCVCVHMYVLMSVGKCFPEKPIWCSIDQLCRENRVKRFEQS